MTARSEKTFWFDSSDVGSGPLETRVCGRYEDGHLDLWLADTEKTVLFTNLSARDKDQVQAILGLTWEERYRIAHYEFDQIRLQMSPRLLRALKEATQHLTSLGQNTKHYERVIQAAERMAK